MCFLSWFQPMDTNFLHGKVNKIASVLQRWWNTKYWVHSQLLSWLITSPLADGQFHHSFIWVSKDYDAVLLSSLVHLKKSHKNVLIARIIPPFPEIYLEEPWGGFFCDGTESVQFPPSGIVGLPSWLILLIFQNLFCKFLISMCFLILFIPHLPKLEFKEAWQPD